MKAITLLSNDYILKSLSQWYEGLLKWVVTLSNQQEVQLVDWAGGTYCSLLYMTCSPHPPMVRLPTMPFCCSSYQVCHAPASSSQPCSVFLQNVAFAYICVNLYSLFQHHPEINFSGKSPLNSLVYSANILNDILIIFTIHCIYALTKYKPYEIMSIFCSICGMDCNTYNIVVAQLI